MHKRYQHFATAFTLVSAILLGGAIYGIKKFADAPQKLAKVGVTDFNLSKVKRIVKKKDASKVKKKRKKMKKRMKALKPVLSANFSGPSFGLDMGDMGDIGLDSDLLSGDEDVIMDENSVDTKPRVLSRPPMEFPERALSENILNGVVEIRMLIDKEGRVSNTEILGANPKGYFEEATLAMVQEWKFDPATYRGKNVAIWAKQVVRFGE